jgi:hypothetical protein
MKPPPHKGDDAYGGQRIAERAARRAERVGIESTPRTSCAHPRRLTTAHLLCFEAKGGEWK